MDITLHRHHIHRAQEVQHTLREAYHPLSRVLNILVTNLIHSGNHHDLSYDASERLRYLCRQLMRVFE